MVYGRSLEEEELLFDPQTSGGLLLSLPAAQADDLMVALKEAGVDTAAGVGQVVGGDRPFVKVV
jgi:selenide,water dikinase